MSSLIFFGLKRKLYNSKYLIRLLLVFVCIGFVINIDVLYSLFLQTSVIEIKLDESVNEYISYFENTETIHFVENSENTLVYEDKWKLYVSCEIDSEIVNDLGRLIEKIPGNQMYAKYEIEVYHSRLKDISMELIVYTMLYFMLMSRSVSIVQEIIEDKVCGMHTLYLTSLSCNKYVIAKIVEGWIQSFFEVFCVILFGCMWLVLRFGVFMNNGFMQWLESWFEVDLIYIRLDIVMVGVVILLVGLFVLQYVIVVYMSKAKTIEEANHMTIWVHLVPIVYYYLSYGIYQLGIRKVLIMVPGIQTLLLPMSLSFEGSVKVYIIIGCILLLLSVGYVYIFAEKMTRKRMLNL